MTMLIDWWDTWHFAYPAWFWTLAAWLILQMIWPNAWRPSGDAGQMPVFFHPKIDQFMADSSQTDFASVTDKRALSRRLLVSLLKIAIMLSLLTALAQPQRLIEQPPQANSQPVRDIALVLESSVSFVLEDYELQGQPTSRMEVVKAVLDEFVQGLSDNRFSLALYAEQAYSLVPMTFDNQAMRANLQRLQPYLAGRTDQAVGEALGLALREVAQAEQNDSIQKRLVVLVSDGVQTDSRIDLNSIIEYANHLSVPIYTIGIGAGSAPAENQSSGLIYQALQTRDLKTLAEQTNGQFYQVGGQDDLQSVLRSIEQTEGVQRTPTSETRWQTQPLYFKPLAFALVLLLVWWLLTLGGQRWNS